MGVSFRDRDAFLFLFLLLAHPLPLSGQSGALDGRVESSDGAIAMRDVRIEIIADDGSVARVGRTNSDGFFTVTGVPAGSYTVVFTLPAWETVRRSEVFVYGDQTTTLAVEMGPEPYRMDPVTVTTSRHEERLLEAPASISVLDRRDIEEKPAFTIMDHIVGIGGADVIRTGLVDGYMVTRGFNDLLQARMLLLTDSRISRVPGLRFNAPRVLPTTNLDIERIEVARGPASALYGPNAADGVLHVVTKSPIDDPGISFSFAAGSREQDDVPGFEGDARGVIHVEGRVAARWSERFGAKLSGRYFRGTEWRFRDPAEQASRDVAENCLAGPTPENPACRVFAEDPGTVPDLKVLERIGKRDFQLGHGSLDARVDWRPREGTSAVFASGVQWTENSLDQAPVGTGQTRGQATYYVQGRLSADDVRAQAYLVRSHVDEETFGLRSGRGIADRSWLLVGQIQKSATPSERHRLVYGADVLRTVPVTDGLINGIHEDDDEFTEFGAYFQSSTSLNRMWELVVASRGDYHTVLDKMVFSPRAALIYEPAAGHHLRATFNRGFLTPGSIELFIDLFGQRLPLGGPFSYGIRSQGTAERGFSFERIQGRPAMKSPFGTLVGETPETFLAPSTEQLYLLARELLRARDSPGAAVLDAAGIPTEDEVAVVPLLLNGTTGQFEPLPGGFAAITDIPPIEEQTTSTLELGYKGLIEDRFLVSVDLYYSRKENFIGPLLVETPNVFLNGDDLVSFLVSRGVDEASAHAIAIGTDERPGIARIPLGVITPREASDPGPNLLLVSRNFGNVDVFGADVAVNWSAGDHWSLGVATSLVSDDEFEADGLPVALNAPTFKIRTSVGYRSGEAGLEGRLVHRFVNGHAVKSGVFVGEVDDYQVVDLMVGYRLPGTPGIRLQADIQNLLDTGYRTFVGSPELGRLALARLVVDL